MTIRRREASEGHQFGDRNKVVSLQASKGIETTFTYSKLQRTETGASVRLDIITVME
jgi:hypothetical protein